MFFGAWRTPLESDSSAPRDGAAGDGGWQRHESTTHPGSFYYLNEETGEKHWEEGSASARDGWVRYESTTYPGFFYYLHEESGSKHWADPVGRPALGGTWRKLESTTYPGQFYFYNDESGESQWDEPSGFLPPPPGQSAAKKTNAVTFASDPERLALAAPNPLLRLAGQPLLEPHGAPGTAFPQTPRGLAPPPVAHAYATPAAAPARQAS